MKMKEIVALCKQKEIEFAPEFNDFTRMQQESRMSKLRKNWLKLDETFAKQDVKFEKNKNMGGKYVDYYLPEQNAALLVASPSHYCFDQVTPTSKLLMSQKLVEGSEKKPLVKTMSIRHLNQKTKEKMIQDFLQEFKPITSEKNDAPAQSETPAE